MPSSLRSIETGTTLEGATGTYRVVRPLGLAGATAEVFLVERQGDGERFALKLMGPGLEPAMQRRFGDEMAVLQRLHDAEAKLGTHHVPRLAESSDLQEPATQRLLESLERPFMFQELAPGEDVASLLLREGALREPEAVEIASQFAEVLEAVHRAGYTYSDMKLENLFWDREAGHLMVIDWNVVTRGLAAGEAERDRLRAAAYLHQMVTGLPSEVREQGEGNWGVVDRGYRRAEPFKRLTEGTRRILLKAFHPDPAARHGEGREPAAATRAYLEDLRDHALRLAMEPSDLLARGAEAFRDRQWEEALADLDVVERSAHLALEEEQYGELLTMLERVRKDVAKLGRSAFHRGVGRLKNDLYREALRDFEQALQDDPDDGEARLYAIASQLANRIGPDPFQRLRRPLEESIAALVDNNLELAASSLGPVEREAGELPQVRSLKAEIAVRAAVRDGWRLLQQDGLDEAAAAFHEAYGRRDEILKVDQLEESLGDLRDFYTRVEELQRLYQQGDSLLAGGRFAEAAAAFWRARTLSEGAGSASDRYRMASTFAAIEELRHKGDLARALDQCRQARGLYPDDPTPERLEAELIPLRREELRGLATEARSRRDYALEREHLLELREISPADAHVAARLKEVEKDLAEGYHDAIAALQLQLAKDRSLETCRAVKEALQEHRWERFEEGRELLDQAARLGNRISELSTRYDELYREAEVDEMLMLLGEAETEGLLLPQGDPRALRQETRALVAVDRRKQIDRLLRSGATADAIDLCERRLAVERDDPERQELQRLLERGNRLRDLLKSIATIEAQIPGFQPEPGLASLHQTDRGLASLHHLKDLVDILTRLREVEPDLGISDPRYDPQKRRADLQGALEVFLNEQRSKAYGALFQGEAPDARAAWREAVDAASVLAGLQNDGDSDAALDWQSWCRELAALADRIEASGLRLDTADYDGALATIEQAALDPAVESHLSWLRAAGPGELRGRQEEIESLRQARDRSPVAAWAERFLDAELEKARIWEELGRNAHLAKQLLADHQGSRGYELHLQALPVAGQAQALTAGAWDPTGLSLAELKQQVAEAEEVVRRLAEFPRLDRSSCWTNIAARSRDARELLRARIAESAGHAEELIAQLRDTAEDSEARGVRESDVRARIEELRAADPALAGELETRLAATVRSLEKAADSDLRNREDWYRLAELQRRMVEAVPDGDADAVKACLKELEQDSLFAGVVRTYHRLQRIASHALKAVAGEPEPRLKKLLDLRLRHGEFPDLACEIQAVKRQLAVEEAMNRVREAREAHQQASTVEDLVALGGLLDQIQPALLDEADRPFLGAMAEDIKRARLLSEPIEEKEFRTLLARGGGRAPDWLEALRWAVYRFRNGISLNSGAVINFSRAMSGLLTEGSVTPEALAIFRYGQALIQRLRPGQLKTSVGEHRREEAA
jgi:hypothetical protein